MPTPLLQDIEAYPSAGYDLIPLHRFDARDERGRERGKSPRDSGWREVEYPVKEVLQWAGSGFNVGVRLRDTDLIIDFDPRNSPTGEAVLAALELELGVDLSSAPCVVTGSGGFHFYFRIPAGLRLRNQLPEFPGVEFKSIGRQVVAAGSVHPSGALYAWRPGPALSLAPTAPSSLLDAILKPTAKASDAALAAAQPAEVTNAELEELLGQLDPADFRDHDDWLKLMMACHSGTGGAGRAEFIRWSTADPLYAGAGDEIAERWVSLSERPGGVTVATLFWFVLDGGGHLPRGRAEEDFLDVIGEEQTAEEAGDPVLRAVHLDRDREGAAKGTLKNAVAAFGALGISAYYDELADAVRIIDAGFIRAKFPRLRLVLDDQMLVALKMILVETFGVEPSSEKIIDAMSGIAYGDHRNVLEDYLRGLKWDGVPRMDTWLSDYAGADRTKYGSAVGRIFLLGAVARALRPGIKFDTMIVLEGPQGVGKSSLVLVLGGQWALEGLPHADERDIVDAMRGRWLVEMEELAHLQRAEVNQLKAFLSRTSDRARLAYARSARDFPRRCILIGTTNDSAYLRDGTGNRRFLPVNVGVVDLAGLAVVRDQLWAEAVSTWFSNPTEDAIRMPLSLREAAVEEQEARRIPDPWEEPIAAALSKFPGNRISSADLLAKVAFKDATNATTNDYHRLSGVMQRLKWVSKKIRVDDQSVRGYERIVACGCPHPTDNHENGICLFPGCGCAR